MRQKRTTIYDLARELNVSASYVSRALNDHPSINEKVRQRVKKKAIELNYKHNLRAANLRQGSSKTIGVIVPDIGQSFFSEAISGMEEVCFQNNHSLIICQSHESFTQECKAIDTLVHQNVDCILISVSLETQTFGHLDEIRKNDIELIQFDRCLDKLTGYKVVNDNKKLAYNIVKILCDQDYKKIAFLGGPEHLPVFKSRKDGYLKAIKEKELIIPYNFIVDNILSREKTLEAAKELLTLKEPPDAFLSVCDDQSLAVLQTAELLGFKVPEQLGIFGFANEKFTNLLKPALSSVDQNSKELGKQAARLYFDNILNGNSNSGVNYEEIVQSEIIIRKSSLRKTGA
jgi:DNA-binding LacI/PurR family transcriptional regulator